MTFFPTNIQSNLQVLWQPVAVQQIHNQTIEQLRHQNLMLKSQLDAALKGQNPNQFPRTFDHRSIETDRFSLSPSLHINLARRPSDNAYYSPRIQPIHQRIYSNYSPRLPGFFSPNHHPQPQPDKLSITTNATRMNRMIISKGKDKKYFRDQPQENQQFHPNWNTYSHFTKKNTPQMSLKTTPMRSPLKRSILLNIQECQNQNIQNKPTISRLRSPAFLKQRHKEATKQTQSTTKRVQIASPSKQKWNDPRFKRFLTTRQDSQTTNKQSQIKLQQETPAEKFRKSIKLPTIDLSLEHESQLSIDKAIRELKKEQPTRKCDSFLFEIEQALSEMYQRKEQQ